MAPGVSSRDNFGSSAIFGGQFRVDCENVPMRRWRVGEGVVTSGGRGGEVAPSGRTAQLFVYVTPPLIILQYYRQVPIFTQLLFFW